MDKIFYEPGKIQCELEIEKFIDYRNALRTVNFNT